MSIGVDTVEYAGVQRLDAWEIVEILGRHCTFDDIRYGGFECVDVVY